jgi:hypothetical protein
MEGGNQIETKAIASSAIAIAQYQNLENRQPPIGQKVLDGTEVEDP